MTDGHASLRAQLLRWLLLPLAAIWAVGAVLTQVTVRRAMNAAFDRSLHASALAISERVTLWSGSPVVDLPPVALEMLDTGVQERIFYRVSYRSPGREEAFLTGYPDLPPPPREAALGKPVFYEETYRGERIRIAALTTTLPTAETPTVVLVQVAETLLGRKGLTQEIVGQSLGSEVVLIVIAGGLVWFAVRRGLVPLSELSREVARRSAADLAPLHPQEVPEEVLPLVDSLNQLMGRVRDAIKAQRRFIADASHQLRTPLAVLRAQVDFALRQEDPGAVRDALAQLGDHTRATSRLASQLLSLARAEPLADTDMALLDLGALARETCAAMVPEALARGIDLGFEGDGPALVRGHDVLLREILANLVDNAMRYGAPRGSITVSVAGCPPDAVALAVEDDGPGIPEAERDRVLERFYRIRGSPGDGCGLGLSIVREVAQGHRASVNLVEGAGGLGLRVEIRFPAGNPR